jgi:N-methylhydantoinase A
MMIGVDVGGTFTDVVAVTDGRIKTIKVATNISDTELAVLEGAREAGVADASAFNHASTHGLNAVITRSLPKVAFLTTVGHRDILDAGRTWRPPEALTDPHWRRSFGDAARPIVPRYLRREIIERITADGNVLVALDERQVIEQLQVIRDCDVQGVAVCFLNAYLNQTHEERVRELVRQELGELPCSISSEVSPLAKEFARASTTVIDVSMKLIYVDYTDRLAKGLVDEGFRGELNYANCAAQLVPASVAMRRPFEVIFAGPAAGTMASAHFGGLIETPNLLCADVGGTSCDISLVADGKPKVDTTFEIEHDLIVNALSNEVSSIGAGGGSLVTISPSGELQVGPGSAGADPGPACYGKGGDSPTTTDTCLLMGIIDPCAFAGGRMRLDRRLAVAAFEALESPLSYEDRVRYAFNIGVNNVAEGVVNIAIKNGIDPRDFSIVAFGAAGPMLLPATLELVNAREVIVPPHPGLFSALGLVSSDQVFADSRSAYTIFSPDAATTVDAVYAQMEQDLQARLGSQAVEFVRSFDGLLVGQSWETPFIPVPSGRIDAAAIEQMISSFHDTYAERTGNRFEDLPVQGVTYRVEAVIAAQKVDYEPLAPRTSGSLASSSTFKLEYLEAEPLDAAVYDRADLRRGDVVTGPAVIREAMSTTFVLPGQQARVGEYGELHITMINAKSEGGLR